MSKRKFKCIYEVYSDSTEINEGDKATLMYYSESDMMPTVVVDLKNDSNIEIPLQVFNLAFEEL